MGLGVCCTGDVAVAADAVMYKASKTSDNNEQQNERNI